MSWVHRCMIVAASVQAQAQSLAANLQSGAGMWTTPVSPTGLAPATHYITAGMIWPQFANWLTGPQALVDGLATVGVVETLTDATNLLANSDVSTDEPFTALARLGLQLIQQGAI